MRVLVIEDETKVADALEQGLEAEGYDAVVARTGEDGFYLLSAEVFDVVILDLMLPGRDGLEILETLRRRGVETPVLVLTARDAVEDRVVGLVEAHGGRIELDSPGNGGARFRIVLPSASRKGGSP